MPELPEVETIVRYLQPRVRGKRIVGFEPLSRRVCRDHGHSREIQKSVVGQKIVGVRRLGKNIIFPLSNGTNLLIHLMMTGRLWWNPEIPQPHDRLIIKLSGDNRLVFNDIRQFGKCRILKNLENLVGEDPFAIRFDEFKNLIDSRKGIVKSLLLNQNIIAGIGNIYADEILWQAGIHPLRKVATLNNSGLSALYKSVQSVLKKAIEKGGSSMQWYQRPDGSDGGYYRIRKVYGRAGEKCSRDGTIIHRIVAGQRSTYFCPRHQQ